MLKIAVATLFLFFSTVAFAENNHIPGCCTICGPGLQACGDSCMGAEYKCPLPIGMGCACDKVYIDRIIADRTHCCQYKGGSCGVAGDHVLCCDGSPSDVCGAEFLLYDQTNPRLYTDPAPKK